MAIEIEMTLNGFKKMIKLAKNIKHETIYNKQIICCKIIICRGGIIDYRDKNLKENILLFDDYDSTFTLLKNVSGEVMRIQFNGGGGSIEYTILHDEILSNFQNITFIFIREADIFSVDDNKLLFFSDASFDCQEYNPHLSVDEDLSMKLLFDETNFELVEYATVAISAIIKDNYYYSLQWVEKMHNLKRLNLILSPEEKFKDVEQFINEMNITTNLKTFIINGEVRIDCSKLKIPFGAKLELL